ncbi:EexN family lipoprotein [Salipiger mangrovisoli]|nr:EexN family lipoprotein [Salipiger mangrovisoli]
MKLATSMLVTLIAGAALTGCKEEENQTVEYFSADPAARAEMLESCEVSDRAAEDANCVNADDAERAAQRDQDSEGFSNVFGEPSFD